MALVFPSTFDLETRVRKKHAQSLIGEFVTVLGMDSFAVTEVKIEASRWDLNPLVAQALDVHLDS
jgi:hypothetical protein